MECPYPAARILDDDYYPDSREGLGRHD
nr:hypothetical protein [uncultured Thiocystis sp.]